MTHSEHAPEGSLARFFYEMREGSRRQGNVIFALIFRELKTRSGTEGYGLLSLVGVLLEPAAGVIVLSAIWYTLKRQDIDGVHTALFLAASYIPFSIVRRSISSVPRTIRSNRSFYAFQNVKPFDAVLARFILEVALMLMGGGIVLFLLWWFLDLSFNNDHLLSALGLMALLIMLSFGLSLVIGIYGTRFPVIFKVLSMASRGLIFLSAVMHTVGDLPPEAQNYIAYNPLAHFMELFRQAVVGITPFQGVSFYYAAMSAIVMLFFGFISYYANRYKVIER